MGVPSRNASRARAIMIQLTRLNGQPLIINSDMIKLIENAPDTVISLVNGEKFVVREPGDQVLERIVQFRRRVLDGLRLNFSGWTAPRAESPDSEASGPVPEEP
jgi:flagellar protein FlbD